jgi:hypothetical protein
MFRRPIACVTTPFPDHSSQVALFIFFSNHPHNLHSLKYYTALRHVRTNTCKTRERIPAARCDRCVQPPLPFTWAQRISGQQTSAYIIYRDMSSHFWDKTNTISRHTDHYTALATRILEYNYHISGYYPLSCLLS